MRQTLVLLTLAVPFVIALVAPAAGLTARRIADDLAAITTVRPLDVQVTVPGDHTAGEIYEFAHMLGPDPESLHPVAVYSQDYATLWGMGEHATAFDTGSRKHASLFGDGRDGDLTVPSGQTVTINSTRTSITASGVTATVGSSTGFGVGDRVFVHQSQGTANVGRYELATIAAIDGASWTFAEPLAHTYSSASGKAQVVRVPQYGDVTVQGMLTAPAWNGSTGGTLVFLVQESAQISGVVTMSTNGFRGITTNLGRVGHQGEGAPGVGSASSSANGNGGGGGNDCEPDLTCSYDSGGGGGGNGTAGGGGQSGGGVASGGGGGATTGSSDLRTMNFGGAGGQNGDADGYQFAGGRGGGIILVSARQWNQIGNVRSDGGTPPYSGNDSNAGGGAGGSILLRASKVALLGATTALGGSGGLARHCNGGAGGAGRIRLEYCESLSGETSPAANRAQVSCHLIEQLGAAPYDGARLGLPETFLGGRTYAAQYGRLIVFGPAGARTTTLRIPAGEFSAATLDALLMNHEAGALFRLDIGADGTWDWSTSPAEGGDIRLSSPDLAEAFNAYWSAQGQPRQGNLDVPVVVWGNAGMEALLTNLVMLQFPNPSPTPTHTPTQTATPTPEHWLALPMAVRMPTPTPSYWCDPYEPNGDRWTNPWGPLQPGQTYEAKLCQGDLEDNYHFRLPQAGTVSLRLELPGSLVGHTGVWVYAREHLATGAELFGLGPIQSSPAELTRWLGPGEYLVRIYTDGASDDAHPYRLRVGW